MQIFKSLFIILLLGISSAGCHYSNDDVYTVNPVPGNPAVITATTNLDTLIDPTLGDSLLVTYRVEIDNGKLYFIESLVDNYQVYGLLLDYNPDTLDLPFVVVDSFWVPGALPLDSGVLPLYLVIYHSTNANNLADILGVESDYMELEYEVIKEGGEK